MRTSKEIIGDALKIILIVRKHFPGKFKLVKLCKELKSLINESK